MSTLTKVLIILLTISSIFLCGIVVTYVANAVNYKQQYEDQRRDLQAARAGKTNADNKFNDLQKQMEDQKLQFSSQIADLGSQVAELETKLAEAERQKALLLQKVNSWTSIVNDFTQTNKEQGDLLQKTLDDLNEVQAALIDEQNKHKETTTALIERMAIVAILEDKSAQLLEEKTELQRRMDQLLRQFGRTVAVPEPVTMIREKARLAPPVKDIGLRGLINAVDLNNLLAEISIGAADGVKDGTRFHVTRGDRFICDIVIFDVQPDRAIGWLELLQPQPDQQPRAGDNVSTNL